MSDKSALTGLLERGREVEQIDDALAGARSGAGTLSVVVGAPGIGKTALIDESCLRARRRGIKVLRARGGEVETGMAFAVVRQLLEAELSSRDPGERDDLLAGAASHARNALSVEPSEAPGSLEATLHGLYWLVSNLAERSPILLAVDDTHWVDAPSLRWLLYLASRLDSLGVAMILATRPLPAESPPALLTELVLRRAARRLDPAPLSSRAVGQLLALRYGRPSVDEAFADAFTHATGGAPLLIDALASRVMQAGVVPSADSAGKIAALAPEALSLEYSARLAAAGPSARRLAQAVAVLGLDTPLRRAVHLAGLDTDDGFASARALEHVGILRSTTPLEFVHPVARSAVYSTMTLADRCAAHRRAAELLDQDGDDAQAIAAHLMATEPASDAHVVERLVQAAEIATASGAPDAAREYLERALREPPQVDVRALVLLHLGRCCAAVQDTEASRYFEAAMRAAQEPGLAREAAGELIRDLVLAGDVDGALRALKRIGGVVSSLDQAALEVDVLMLAQTTPAARTRVAPRLQHWERRALEGHEVPDTTIAQCYANVAYDLAIQGRELPRALELADAAVATGELFARHGADAPIAYFAVAPRLMCGRLEEAEAGYDAIVARARADGSARGYAMAMCWRAFHQLQRGRIDAAEQDASSALEVSNLHGWGYGLPVTLHVLASVRIERDDVDGAAVLLAAHDLGAFPQDSMLMQYLHVAYGRVLAAQGDHAGALRKFLDCLEWQRAWRWRNTWFMSAHAPAVTSLLAIGDTDRARSVADTAVEAARATGLPVALGEALLARGGIGDEPEALATLVEAERHLRAEPARLLHCRALVALGTMRARVGEHDEAAAILREAFREALRCGSRREAQAVGATLRSLGISADAADATGIDALTPQERRVAELAAEGMRNREIAQHMFLSLKTVEMHLTQVYRKLELRSRAELYRALH